METIAERLKSTLQTLEQTVQDAKRPSHSVQLLAVSKTKPVSDIVLAYEAGQRCFGENYVQEGAEKIHALQHLSDIEWHFIGPLQSNKSRLVAENFDWMQTLDREKIALRLNEQRPEEMPPLQVCIQVNINDESSKSGVQPGQVLALAAYISQLPKLTLRGLMTIPAVEQSETQQRQTFAMMKNLFEQLQLHYSQVDTLSMGMSGDMQLAIEEGATMVRVGTAIFGRRN